MAKNLVLSAPLSKPLRDARRERKWTQADLAERAGVFVKTVAALERGRGSVDTFEKVAAALGCVLSYRNAAGTIAEVIRTLRRRRALSQRELACLAGVSQPTIGTLERSGRGQFAPLERVLNSLGAGAYVAQAERPKAFYSHAGTSSVSMEWETPADFLELLHKVFGKWDLDPCSPRRNGPVRAKVRFTAEDDGLSLPWNGRVFTNPPYGRGLGIWVAKARLEHESGNAKLVVLLIPARPDTSYWHEHIADHAEVVFIRGRLRFGNSKTAAPFPSALAIYGATSGELLGLREALRDPR